MHIRVSCYPREYHQLPKVHQVELRNGGILLDSLGYLLIRTFIFIFGQPFGQLTHILHRYLTAICLPVYTSGDIT